MVRRFFATKAGETSRRRWGRGRACCERRRRGQHDVWANLSARALIFLFLFVWLSFLWASESRGTASV